MTDIEAEAIRAANPSTAADVPALLARIAELEAERRRSPAEHGEPCTAEPWPGGNANPCVLPGGHHVHWNGKGDVWQLLGEHPRTRSAEWLRERADRVGGGQ